MSGPIFAIRPEPGCSATVEAGRRLGLTIEGRPLFAIRALAWDPPEAEHIDGLLLGSANAVRHAGAGLAPFRGKRAFAVARPKPRDWRSRQPARADCNRCWRRCVRR
jgi:uroporphyrinogen-III synthase